ncbi:MAG: tetratricopeptide repeat protein [Planctomycetes bacterium]|nr:tetratricopeptide repeat protein [Planctomycetota bacterium]
MTRILALAAAVLGVALAARVPAEVVTLKDGTVLQGQILEGDEKGLRLQRFDTGGVVFLPWNFLHDRDRDRIRRDRGLDIGELDAFQIPGVRIEMLDRTVYEGVMGEQEPDKIWLHTAQSRIPILTSRIVRQEAITVNAVEVYPPDKLYDDRMAEGRPTDVDSHFELGKFCMQIELYDKAIEHFGKVQELDPQYKPDFVQKRLTECQVMLANRAQAELVNRITRLLYANKFKEALDQIAALEQLEDLDPVWKTKLADKKKEAGEKRESFLIRSIAATMPPFIRHLAEVAGKDRNLSLPNARNYAQRDLSRDLRARLVNRFEIEEKEVRDFIAKIKSYHQFKVSYGDFTWFAPGETPPTFQRQQSGRTTQSDRGRITRASDRSRQSQQQREKPLPKADELWAQSIAKQRTSFIHALWAERAREVHVVRIERQACSVCAGRGTTRITGEGGIVEIRCTRCRGIGSDRVVVYRIGPGDGQGNVASPASEAGQGLTPAERLRQKLLERQRGRTEPGGQPPGGQPPSGGDRPGLRRPGGDRR